MSALKYLYMCIYKYVMLHRGIIYIAYTSLYIMYIYIYICVRERCIIVADTPPETHPSHLQKIKKERIDKAARFRIQIFPQRCGKQKKD